MDFNKSGLIIDQTTRVYVILIVFVVCYFIVLGAGESLNPVSDWVGKYVPSIKKLIKKNHKMPRLAANYFAFSAFFLVPLTVYLCWGINYLERVKTVARLQGRSFLRRLFFLYFLGMPFVLVMLYLIYESPELGVPRGDQVTRGGILGEAMIYTHVGLLVFGVAFNGGVVSLVFSVYALVSIPLIYILTSLNISPGRA